MGSALKALLVGAGFNNKGAELMVAACVQWLRSIDNNIEVYMSPLEARSIKNLELYQLLPLQSLLPPLSWSPTRFALAGTFEYLTNVLFYSKYSQFRKPKLAKLKDIDIVFDISGLAYSDKWGTRPISNLRRLVLACESRGTKYVLMPQAFGPFELPINQVNMKIVLENATQTYARDAKSLRACERLDLTFKDKVKLSGDLSSLVRVRGIAMKDALADKCKAKPTYAIVPNARMLDKGGLVWQTQYIDWISSVAEYISQRSEIHCTILAHTDSIEDQKLVMLVWEELQRRNVSRSVYDLEVRSAVELKELIASYTFVIGSRYHALTSALYLGIPCLGTSWQHKYEELFKEFGIDEYMIPAPVEVRDLINNLLDIEQLGKLKMQIARIADTKRNALRQELAELATRVLIK